MFEIRYLQSISFGVQFHRNCLSVLWSVVINFAVFIAIFKYKKYSFWLHLFAVSTVIILTSVAVAMLDFQQDIKSLQLKQDDPLIEEIHDSLGSLIVFWLALQVLLGIGARKIQESINIHTSKVIIIKKAHRFCSYGVLLIAMLNLVNRRFQEGDYRTIFIIIVFQIVCITVYIKLKFSAPTMSQKIIDSQIQSEDIKQINSQKQIPSSIEYLVFADYVYDIEPLRGLHPGGQQVIQMVKGREIDRFLYGMYAAEYSTGVSPVQHSSRCLQLVGEPISKINRIPILSGLQSLNDCSVVSKTKIASESTTHLVLLKPFSQKPLKYMGYTSSSQFGQYFSLTMDDKVTRLYTTVFCMRKQNLQFMQQYFPGSTKLLVFQNKPTINRSLIEMTQLSLNSSLKKISNDINYSQNIPLLLKKYQKGKLTPQLLNENIENNHRKINLSLGKGSGMKFDIIGSGKIIIVTGGTGIFPFIDFIDILFKKSLVLQKHLFSESLIQRDSILRQDIFKNKQIHLWAAINSPYDIPSHTLYQINHLCQLQIKQLTFKCQFKVKNNVDMMNRHFNKIPLTSKRFDSFVLEQIIKEETEMTYVCGPPQMNSSMINMFIENKIDKKKYHFL